MRVIILLCLSLLGINAYANKFIAHNAKDVEQFNLSAKSGDTCILKSGKWENIKLKFTCQGNAEKHIVIMAEQQGRVQITGNSSLSIGGSYIDIQGLWFKDGFSGSEPVIRFMTKGNSLANHCRITHCSIDNFNNTKRLDENYWIALHGQQNRIDHCSFLNKKNLGVLIAVILKEDNSRNNFHRIDNNYFGTRIPLASNAGEIIRIGVSEHCTLNSNTIIENNVFEHCDGETEIISVKSCKNIIRNNFFIECQGGVVLRHGNENIIEGNVFWGNGKEGTGGVRVINKGHWIVNNLFYKCIGVDFRSPLSIMNGVPNSPANRYLPVEDVVISNNSFIGCSKISLCEGSDTERSVAPKHVIICNNLFNNNSLKSLINIYDNIDGFRFVHNAYSKSISQQLPKGFDNQDLMSNQLQVSKPNEKNIHPVLDSLQAISKKILSSSLQPTIGITKKSSFTASSIQKILNQYKQETDFNYTNKQKQLKPKHFTCASFQQLKQACLDSSKVKHIIFSGKNLDIEEPLNIVNTISLESNHTQDIVCSSTNEVISFFYLSAGSALYIKQIAFDFKNLKSNFICITDTNGSSNHGKFMANKSSFKNMNQPFCSLSKSYVLDSLSFSYCNFIQSTKPILQANAETDKKGYYNAEKIVMNNNSFIKINSNLIDILRTGNDESTMGPKFVFKQNTIQQCESLDNGIKLTGVQQSFIIENKFVDCYNTSASIVYKDWVRANHKLTKNSFKNSGRIVKNQFVKEE